MDAEARVIALDVGGTSIKSALVAPGGRVLGEPVETPVDSGGEAGPILDTLARVVSGHLERVYPTQLLGITLGFPGPFDYPNGICLVQGLVKYGAIYGLDLRAALRACLDLPDLPILFRNDAEAAAVGEARFGAGQPYRQLIAVTLGTGCGSAFVRDGLPVTSGPGLPPNGWLYPILFRGVRADDCFSKRGLEARLHAASVGVAGVKEAANAARAGDQVARQVFSTFGADLGAFLDPFALAFQAEAVLVLGQIAGALDLFGLPLRQTLSVPAIPGRLGANAALLGTADLIFNQR
jgi:glucokinase